MDIKHAFSRGRLTISHLRRSLSDWSVHANTILGSWAHILELIPEKEVTDFLADKKGKHTATAPVPDINDNLDGMDRMSTAAEEVDDNDDL